MGLKRNEYSTGEIKLGEWNNNFQACYDKAKLEHTPLVIYWTPGHGCGQCDNMETKCFRNSSFKEWQKTTPYIWCYTEGENHIVRKVNHDGYNMRGPSSQLYEYPYVWLHWHVSNNFTINSWFTGRPSQMLDNTKSDYDRFKESILIVFDTYVPPSNL